MEAIERFFNVSEISNPKLVVIVGSLGLASNIIGLFLFHGKPHPLARNFWARMTHPCRFSQSTAMVDTRMVTLTTTLPAPLKLLSTARLRPMEPRPSPDRLPSHLVPPTADPTRSDLFTVTPLRPALPSSRRPPSTVTVDRQETGLSVSVIRLSVLGMRTVLGP